MIYASFFFPVTSLAEGARVRMRTTWGHGLMNKSDLIKSLAAEYSLPLRKAEEIVAKVFDTMYDALKYGDRIEIRGFGSFTVKKYDGYTGRNPKTGAQIHVEAKRLPFFKAGKNLLEQLNSDS